MHWQKNKAVCFPNHIFSRYFQRPFKHFGYNRWLNYYDPCFSELINKFSQNYIHQGLKEDASNFLSSQEPPCSSGQNGLSFHSYSVETRCGKKRAYYSPFLPGPRNYTMFSSFLGAEHSYFTAFHQCHVGKSTGSGVRSNFLKSTTLLSLFWHLRVRCKALVRPFKALGDRKVPR